MRTTTQAAITGSAGQVDLVAAVTGLKIYVVTLVIELDTAGSIVFQEGTGPTNLTGVVELLADTPFALFGSVDTPVLQTNTRGAKLGVTTTGGAPKGWLRYYVE